MTDNWRDVIYHFFFKAHWCIVSLPESVQINDYETQLIQEKIDRRKALRLIDGDFTEEDGKIDEEGSGDEGGEGGATEMDRMSLENVPQILSNPTQAIGIIGFEPEVYEGGEIGFRVQRANDGSCLKPAFEVMTKSPEEMDEMEKAQKKNEG